MLSSIFICILLCRRTTRPTNNNRKHCSLKFIMSLCALRVYFTFTPNRTQQTDEKSQISDGHQQHISTTWAANLMRHKTTAIIKYKNISAVVRRFQEHNHARLPRKLQMNFTCDTIARKYTQIAMLSGRSASIAHKLCGIQVRLRDFVDLYVDGLDFRKKMGNLGIPDIIISLFGLNIFISLAGLQCNSRVARFDWWQFCRAEALYLCTVFVAWIFRLASQSHQLFVLTQEKQRRDEWEVNNNRIKKKTNDQPMLHRWTN